MAKRPRPPQEVTDHHVDIMRPLAQKLERQRKKAAETEKELGDAVRAAFEAGVLVGPIKEAIGLSGSRCYQIKFYLRDNPVDTQAD